MDQKQDFYTMKGYEKESTEELTPAMEDYLEMICRLLDTGAVVRVGDLSERLHVAPSSASKMVRLLSEQGYVDFPRYGYISVTRKGSRAGTYLLRRHEIVSRFLCALNHSESETEQVEKIEHFLDERTVRNLERLTEKMNDPRR